MMGGSWLEAGFLGRKTQVNDGLGKQLSERSF